MSILSIFCLQYLNSLFRSPLYLITDPYTLGLDKGVQMLRPKRRVISTEDVTFCEWPDQEYLHPSDRCGQSWWKFSLILIFSDQKCSPSHQEKWIILNWFHNLISKLYLWCRLNFSSTLSINSLILSGNLKIWMILKFWALHVRAQNSFKYDDKYIYDSLPSPSIRG